MNKILFLVFCFSLFRSLEEDLYGHLPTGEDDTLLIGDFLDQ